MEHKISAKKLKLTIKPLDSRVLTPFWSAFHIENEFGSGEFARIQKGYAMQSLPKSREVQASPLRIPVNFLLSLRVSITFKRVLCSRGVRGGGTRRLDRLGNVTENCTRYELTPELRDLPQICEVMFAYR